MTEAEKLARDFASKFDTPAVRTAIDCAETGALSWEDIAALFAKSYGTAKRSV